MARKNAGMGEERSKLNYHASEREQPSMSMYNKILENEQ